MKPHNSYQRTNKNKLMSPSVKVFSGKIFGWVDPPKFLYRPTPKLFASNNARSITQNIQSLTGDVQQIEHN